MFARLRLPTAHTAAYALALLAAIEGAACWFVSDVGTNDLWWHLAAGRELFAQGAVPRTDTLSFTCSGCPWLNHEWLWGAVAFALYRAEPFWLALAQLALLACTYALCFVVAHGSSRSLSAAVLACWLAAACNGFFSDLRPHHVTPWLALFLLATREQRWAAWSWPAVLVLWCNLHGGFVFGLGMLGLLLLVRSAQARSLRALRWQWAALGACVLAIGLNPWGYRVLEFVLSYAPGPQRSLYAHEINDFQPLGFELAELRFTGFFRYWLTFRGRYLALLLLAACGALRLARRDPFLVLLGAISVLMALRAQRFVALSSLLLVPLAAHGITLLSAALAARFTRRDEVGRPWLPAAALAALALAAFGDVRLLPRTFERWTQPNLGPVAAVRYLAAWGAPLRVLSFETWAGQVSLLAPHLRVFFDGRANTVYGPELYADYLALMRGEPSLPQLLAKYRPDVVLVPRIRIVDSLRALPQPWLLAYEDQLAQVFVAPDSPWLQRPLPNPDAVLAAEPQWLRRKAALAAVSGDVQGALHRLERALQLDPLFLPAYTELMGLLAAHAGMPAAEQVAARAAELLPERRHSLQRRLAALYEQAGDARRAAALYRGQFVAGPFDPQRELRERVLQLEAAEPRASQ